MPSRKGRHPPFIMTMMDSGVSRLDPEPLAYEDQCSEKGCQFPARWLVSDMWGRVPVCRNHLMQLQSGHSLEDRLRPLELVKDSSTGPMTGKLA